jgi:hypothetical protein
VLSGETRQAERFVLVFLVKSKRALVAQRLFFEILEKARSAGRAIGGLRELGFVLEFSRRAFRTRGRVLLPQEEGAGFAAEHYAAGRVGKCGRVDHVVVAGIDPGGAAENLGVLSGSIKHCRMRKGICLRVKGVMRN